MLTIVLTLKILGPLKSGALVLSLFSLMVNPHLIWRLLTSRFVCIKESIIKAVTRNLHIFELRKLEKFPYFEKTKVQLVWKLFCI